MHCTVQQSAYLAMYCTASYCFCQHDCIAIKVFLTICGFLRSKYENVTVSFISEYIKAIVKKYMFSQVSFPPFDLGIDYSKKSPISLQLIITWVLSIYFRKCICTPCDQSRMNIHVVHVNFS